MRTPPCTKASSAPTRGRGVLRSWWDRKPIAFSLRLLLQWFVAERPSSLGEREKIRLDQPDETRTFEIGKAEVVKLGDFTASRLVFEPGWRWSETLSP